jgi:ElaA protein
MDIGIISADYFTYTYIHFEIHFITKMKHINTEVKMLIIKKFDELSTKELYEILKLREAVFIVEQSCIYNDLDDKDYDCIHIMIQDNNLILGYLRVLKPNISYPDASFGRVVVDPKHRGKGIAKELVQNGINYIKNNFDNSNITIGAQEYLKDFYSSFGFNPISTVYIEDGIPHIDMQLKISK